MRAADRDAAFSEFVAARQAHLRRIAYALCGDWHKADDLPDRGAPQPTPVEERSALFDALQGLPEQQRKVVVLRHWLGLSVRETASELGITEGTVKSHSSRGLAALEAVLAPHR